jgi:hypothetical protein
VNDILDPDGYELVNGNYHLICDNNDDLQVKVCLFYYLVNNYPFGQCVRQNNVTICKCGSDNNSDYFNKFNNNIDNFNHKKRTFMETFNDTSKPQQLGFDINTVTKW